MTIALPSTTLAISAERATAVDPAKPDLKTADDRALYEVAKNFEAAFMAEMLKHSGLGETRGSFGGGYGEEAFQSFLTREYAQALSEKESLGLASQIYAQLKQKVAEND